MKLTTRNCFDVTQIEKNLLQYIVDRKKKKTILYDFFLSSRNRHPHSDKGERVTVREIIKKQEI